LIAAIVAVLLVAGGIVAYRGLDPDALRALAERHASAMLGAPVTIGRMRVSLFPTPAVTGTDVRLQSAGAGRAAAITVRGIRILPQWRTLVSRPLVVDAVEIEGLTLLVRRDAEGRWLLPGAPPGGRSAPDSTSGGVPGLPGGSASDAVAVRAVRLRDGQLVVVDDVMRTPAGSAEVAAIRHIDADLAQRTGGTGALSMRAALGGSPLTGTMEMGPQGLSASVQSPSIRNEDVPAVFALLGSAAPEGLAIGGNAPLDLTMHVARDTGALTASGHLRAARVQVGTATVTGVAAPFRVAEHVLVVDPLTFSAYSGSARARLDARYGAAPVAWTLALGAEGIDVNAFLSANTAGDRLLGTGRIAAHLRGTAATPIAPHVNGTVDVAVANGVIRHFALIAAINRALRITGGEGDDLRFERLSATIHVASGAMRTDDALLTAGDLSVNAAGTIRFDRSIGMTGTARFSREASARMIASVNQISGARNEQGQVEVPFTISGSLDRPAFAIDAAQILGRAVRKEVERDIRKRLDRFLGKP